MGSMLVDSQGSWSGFRERLIDSFISWINSSTSWIACAQSVGSDVLDLDESVVPEDWDSCGLRALAHDPVIRRASSSEMVST